MNYFSFYDLTKNVFNSAKLEERENSNFRKFYEKKYSRENMVTNIRVEPKVYEKLRNFFMKYNQDTQVRTFSEFSYSKYKFSSFKVITYKDLLEEMKNSNSENFEKILFTRNTKIENLDNYVKWEDFFLSIQEVYLNNKLNPLNLDEYLKRVSNRIENKKINFKKYQALYKETKSKIFFSGIKTVFFENTIDPDFIVIKDKF